MSETRVERSIEVPGDAGSVWPLLVRAGSTRAWWGLLDDDIASVAQQLTVHTGTVSCYRIWIESIVVHRSVEFSSAYLGVCPVSNVRIALSETASGIVRVTVAETLPTRVPATVHQAGELWRHRLDRLAAIVRSDDAAVDPCADITIRRTLDRLAWRPLHLAVLRDWLPLSGPGSPPRWFYAVDSDGPRRFPVTRWRVHYDDAIAMGIEIVAGAPPTEAEISVTARAASVELSVRHSGWSAQRLDAETLEVLRDRFAATWRHAVNRAARA